MSRFQQLQDKHIKLLQSHEKNKTSPELLKEVKDYTEEVMNASREIGDSRDRNQLRANLRFWGAYIYDQTGTYPNLNLLPSEGGAEVAPPKTSAINFRWAIIIPVVLVLLTIVYVGGRLQFAPLGNAMSSGDPTALSEIEFFATGTAMAMSTQLGVGPGETGTQTAVPTPLVIPSITPGLIIPTTGGGSRIVGHTFAFTEIQDDTSCSIQRINISILNGFTSDISVEPAVLTISEEGSFRTVVEKQISLTVANLQDTINEAITIPDARGSYLVYITHPELTFDAVIIQHLPDCKGNQTNISYDIPWYEYEQLESRSDFGVNFNLVAWGPYPVLDPTFFPDGIAKIRVTGAKNDTSPIFWIFSDNLMDFELLQNDEFMATSNVVYYIGVTFAGKTVSIPFMFVAPYIDYIQSQ